MMITGEGMKEFQETYKREPNPVSIISTRKTLSFWVNTDLAKAINHAVDRSGYRFTSEFIRATIIRGINRMISASNPD
jgi:hypothetical protein